MNYWVVSPNVNNDGNYEEFLELTKLEERVFMGWYDHDPIGKTFKDKVKLGDFILIAKNSNKNKVAYYCGIVDSESEYIDYEYKSIKFDSQSRKLKYLIDIKDIVLDFKGCAYGDASQMTSIYALYPLDNECDKRLINILMKKIQVTKGRLKVREKINLLKNRKQIILQGPPGTGKTRMAKIIARNIIKNSIGEEKPKINDLSEQVKLIQFHPSYSYEDFVRGIVAESKGENIKYKTENKVLVDMANKAYAALENDGYYKTDDKEEKETILEKSDKYILIIDEINRANLSSVLGELIYALEYRDEAVESMYALEGGSRNITLPSNLYIIGTMNTADRSVGHIDYAIRRRFAFESVPPSKGVIILDEGKKLFDTVAALFKDKSKENKNAETLSLEFDPDDVMLGHSYFIADDKDELKDKLEYQIKPLLREYVKDGVLTSDSKSKIDGLTVEANN